MQVTSPWDLVGVDYDKQFRRAIGQVFRLSLLSMALSVLLSLLLLQFIAAEKRIAADRAADAEQIQEIQAHVLELTRKLEASLAASAENSTPDH